MRRARACALLGPALLGAATAAGSEAPSDRPLAVIALDGIPFAAAQQAYDAGILGRFYPPGRLVAPFPAMTSVSFCEMLAPLGVARPIGYELRHFDHSSLRVRGGGLLDYDDEPAPWKAAFQYEQESLVFKTLAYISPWLAARYEVSRLGRALEELDRPLFFGYIGATDPLVHTEGIEGVVDLLLELDEELVHVTRERQRAGRPPLRVLLLSDHGCASAGSGIGRMVGVDLRDVLDRLGVPQTSDLSATPGVAFPLFGLVSFSALHVSDGIEEDGRLALVRGIAREPGVDLVMLLDGENVVRVVGPGGEALVRRAEDRDAFAYSPQWGDPLGLSSIAGALAEEGLLDADGFAPDRVWWERTSAHVYPDPLRRIIEAFNGLVQNPASVLVSYAPGHCSHRPLAWAGLAILLKDLDGTHGSLDAGSTFGMVMCDYAPAPPAVRGRDVLQEMVGPELLACAPDADGPR